MSGTCTCRYTSTWANALSVRPWVSVLLRKFHELSSTLDGGRDVKIEGAQVERRDADKGVRGNNDRIARLKSSLGLDCSEVQVLYTTWY